MNIFCNMRFPPAAHQMLLDGTARHRLALAANMTESVLAAAAEDPAMADAEIAFGQPDPEALIRRRNIRWVHLTSAGYERYDRDDLRTALRARGTVLTSSSWVYTEPCAEHLLGMMLALARRLPPTLDNQRGPHGWPAPELRADSRLLVGQTALILGFGSIGRRMVELLTPFRMNLMAVRRSVRGDEGIPTHRESLLEELLPQADHVLNILPGGSATSSRIGTAQFARMKPSAYFYNIGRGGTVDQAALLTALNQRQIAAAYLDVMSPEPLPPEHPLWTAPNCHITPHTAGGHHNEFERLVEHFLNNLARYEKRETLVDQVM